MAHGPDSNRTKITIFPSHCKSISKYCLWRPAVGNIRGKD